jgi:uncharacterized protein (TIGR00730 family)
MIRNVTIFCASSKKTAEKYLKLTRELSDILKDNEIGVIYGGGAVGMMGCLADRLLEQGGIIRGIIPEFMVKVEWAHPLVKDMVIVKDMHERKKLLIENTDAVIALPGGTGTLEELMEVLSLKRLGKFFKPIIIVNTDGFYNNLLNLFTKMVEENFLRPEHLKAFQIINKPSELLEAINGSLDWDENAIHSASV